MKNNKEGYEAHSKLASLVKKEKSNELGLAYYLYVLKRYDLWRHAVGGIDRWEDYLKQPEINISTRKANQLIRIWNFFVVKNSGYDISEIPINLLDMITRVESKEHIEELLEAARTLSQSDFKERYLDITKGSSEKDADRTYSYMVMRKCNETGNMAKVHEITSEDIIQKFNLN